MPENLSQEVSRTLTTFERVRNRFFKEWNEHANRRTILVSISLGALFFVLYTSIIAPPLAFPTNHLVTIPEGATLTQAAQILAEEEVVQSAFSFKALQLMLGRGTDTHAGDYLFKQPENIFAVGKAVAVGAYGLEPYRFRVPEGAMMKDMAKIFSSRLERFDTERFLSRSNELEGYLFPDTYFFLPNATDETVAAAMRQNFDEKIATIQADIDAFGEPLEDIVKMASILEREARISEDRKMISGVLWNRIDRNMLLQVDAAFLYSVGRATFDLTLEDLLEKDDPYNTYVHKGFPPTPIGSPSLDSLKAAVTPREHGYFFYLADNTGVTHYSRTYEEHLVKKRRYLGT